MTFNNKQLTFVREYLGYSQTELASHIVGLSQSNLSKFEKGIGLLSSEVIQRIIDFWASPKNFIARKYLIMWKMLIIDVNLVFQKR